MCAKNGGQKHEHHFAHVHGSDCAGAYETTLHLLAKEILQETKSIMLPASQDESLPSGLVHLTDVRSEEWDETYRIRPDVEGRMASGERLLIEFFVSHKVDESKRRRILENGLKCVEINMNYQELERASIREFLTETDEDRIWIKDTVKQPKGDGGSLSYGRNPLLLRVRDFLKEKFDSESLSIRMYKRGEYIPKNFDLRKLKYDTCKVVSKYRGLSGDLLLYRSQKENKGYILLVVRGRRRNYGFRCPKNLKIIDIVIPAGNSLDMVKKRFKNGLLSDLYDLPIEFFGFKGYE